MQNLKEKLETDLKKELSEKRYRHTLSVYEMATELSKVYKVDTYKCQIGALAHDITKENMNKNLEIMNKYYKHEEVMQIKPAWHGYVASIVLKEEYNIEDKEILNAVKYHTLGHENMGDVEKVVYIADFIEPTRKKNNVEYFHNLIGKISLNELMLEVVEYNIKYLKNKELLIPNQTKELYRKLKSSKN